MRIRMIVAIITMIIFASSTVEADSIKSIRKRIKPVGQVEVNQQTNETTPGNQAVLANTENVTQAQTSATSSERSGSEIYQAHCQVCHSPQMAKAMKAPLVHDQAAWDVYFKQTNKNTRQEQLDELVAIAKKGKGTMPPMGTCMNCTDSELRKAIEFMSSKKE